MTVKKLLAINVDGNNTTYSSDNGVLFNKNKTEVLYCPRGKSGKYTIPNGVTHINSDAFSYCEQLTNIVIPNSVSQIDEGAFCYCQGLTEITVPGSVKNIGAYTFGDCVRLTKVTLSDGVESIDSELAFNQCYDLTTIIIPESVTQIAKGEFSHSTELTIYGKRGSTAEKYANENKISFKEA